MVNYKVNSPEDNKIFTVTRAYGKICDLFKDLKTQKGRIIHILGAPGTGKSANIYEAIKDLNLNVYDAILMMDDVDKSSKEVFKDFFNSLKYDLKVKKSEDVYLKVAEYDAILFADKFHDSHLLYENKVGFSLWVDHKGFKTLPFYILSIYEYIRHIKEFKNLNLIFQTAWTVRVKGVKYDLFTDLGVFSRLLVGLLKLLFDVVEVSYLESEIIEIVQNLLPDTDEERIKPGIRKYRNKIRFILESLKKD